MMTSLLQWIVSPIILLLLGYFLNKKIKSLEHTSNEVKAEVKNSHEVNFRDDIDAKFKSLDKKFEGMHSRLDEHASILLSQREDISKISERQSGVLERLLSL